MYAVGSFYQVFTPGFGLHDVTSQGSNDVFLTKFNAAGAVDWASTFGGTGSELCSCVALGEDGTISKAGAYGTTVDFEPDPVATHELTNPKYANMFLLKLRQK